MLKHRLLCLFDQPEPPLYLIKLLEDNQHQVHALSIKHLDAERNWQEDHELVLLCIQKIGLTRENSFARLNELVTQLDLPVILILDERTQDQISLALELGVADIQVHPFFANELLLRIKNILDLRHLRQRLADLVQEKTTKLQLSLTHLHKLDLLKDQFIESLSHELRAPLASIYGYAEALTECQPQDRFDEFTSIIREETNRLNHLIENLVELINVPVGTDEFTIHSLHLNDLVSLVLESFSKRLEEAPELKLFCRLDPVIFEGDQTKLIKALTGLLEESLRFSMPSGSIKLQSLTREKDFTLFITDEASPLVAGEEEKIFQRFHPHRRVESQLVSTSLALPLAREIVELHGGSLRAINQEEGVSFAVTLPYEQDKSQSLDLIHRFGHLRKRAESQLQDPEFSLEHLDEGDVQQLVQNLNIHQIELEIQNQNLRKTQEELYKAHDRYQGLFHLAPVGFLTLSDTAIIHEANDRACQLLGDAPHNLIRRPLSRFIDPADHGLFFSLFRIFTQNHLPRSMELRLLSPDGEQIYVKMNLQMAHAPGNSSNSSRDEWVLVAMSDITSLKHAEMTLQEYNSQLESMVAERTQVLAERNQELQHRIQEIAEKNARLRLSAKVIESTSEAVVITDSNNKIVEVNQAFCQITGYSFDEVKGQDPGMMKSGQHDQAFYQAMWADILDKGVWQGEIWDRKKSGELYPKALTVNLLKDDEGKVLRYIGLFSDISKMKQVEEQLRRQAFYDSLTNLPNRRYFQERLETALSRAKREDGSLAVIFVDLDRFKMVNDSYGHPYGDQVLVQVGMNLRESLRSEDMLARLGGDEFTVLIDKITLPETPSLVAQKIIELLNRPLLIEGKAIFTGGSVGIALYPQDGQTSHDLMKAADTAMYQAKAQGSGSIQFFSEEMNKKVQRHMFLDSAMRKALAQNEFALHYQPQMDVASGRVASLEALVRWQHPEKGLLPPDQFIPVAEDSGFILKLGEWIIREACQQVGQWKAEGLGLIPVAINLSARQFHQANFMEALRGILAETGTDPSQIEFELTESLLIKDVEESVNNIKALKDLGIKTAVDDFGTGYSSLSYLKRFPIDKLKIDRAFIKDILTDPNDRVIAGAMIDLSHNLSLQVVAEGVETQEQLDCVKDLGCNLVQGYFFHRPMKAEDISKILEAQGGFNVLAAVPSLG